MTQKETRGKLKALPALVVMVVVLTIAGGALAVTPNVEERASPGVAESFFMETAKQTPADASSDAVIFLDASTEPPTNPWHNYPNACETFTVLEGSKLVKTKKGKRYPVRYRRNRYKRRRSDQRRTHNLIKMIVKEMGGDRDAESIVSMIAMHESSWNPEAIHILNPDLSANQQAWTRHSYHRSTEMALEENLTKVSAKTKKFWDIKARLHDVRLYKDNPHWNDELGYTYRVPERSYQGETIPASEWQGHRSVWAFGYGLYGMNAVLFTHIWDREAPPWVLCGDEGIEATIMAVWVLRHAETECATLSQRDPEKWGSEGGSARGVVRRFARGRCSDKRLGPAWRKLMAGRDDVDWDAPPNFGHKFGRYETYKRGGKRRFRKEEGRRVPSDRAVIVAYMRAKAEAKGLLREVPLERKVVDSEPVIIAQKATFSTRLFSVN